MINYKDWEIGLRDVLIVALVFYFVLNEKAWFHHRNHDQHKSRNDYYCCDAVPAVYICDSVRNDHLSTLTFISIEILSSEFFVDYLGVSIAFTHHSYIPKI